MATKQNPGRMSTATLRVTIASLHRHRRRAQREGRAWDNAWLELLEQELETRPSPGDTGAGTWTKPLPMGPATSDNTQVTLARLSEAEQQAYLAAVLRARTNKVEVSND